MTVAEALRSATLRLRQAGIENAVGDARHLLANVMDISRHELLLRRDILLTNEEQSDFESAVVHRSARRPVSQITGQRLFWGRAFKVTQDTLDPRPETECLIETALGKPFTRVLDLGTGTGCILLTLLSERPGATGVGVDLSVAALTVANDNAGALGLADRADFRVSDWFADVGGDFDLVVSNPPYIAEKEMADLAPEVRDWEPHLALTPGADGLGAYRTIAAGLGDFLTENGRAIVEIGPSQGPAVTQIFHAAGFSQVEIFRDFDGRDRVLVVMR